SSSSKAGTTSTGGTRRSAISVPPSSSRRVKRHEMGRAVDGVAAASPRRWGIVEIAPSSPGPPSTPPAPFPGVEGCHPRPPPGTLPHPLEDAARFPQSTGHDGGGREAWRLRKARERKPLTVHQTGAGPIFRSFLLFYIPSAYAAIVPLISRAFLL